MLSEVTVSFAGHTFTFASLYLVSGCLIVLLVFGLVIARATAGRIRRKAQDATEIVAIQLERIGIALDRIVIQNAARANNEPARRPENLPTDRAAPALSMGREATEPISPEVAGQMFPTEKKHNAPAHRSEGNSTEEGPVDTRTKAPVRHVAYSIFGR